MRTTGRRLAVLVLALSQLALAGTGPFLDAAPPAPGHLHHIAAESAVGCHTYHDDHCVVCRVLTGGGIAAPAPALASSAVPPAAGAAPGLDRPCPLRDHPSPLQPRAPPIA